MNRIEKLLHAMTLEEKLGQLTMTAAGHAVTGPVIAGDSTEAIRNGSIGNLLNLAGAVPIREMQRLAVEESRLGIPLLFGLDVLHGYRTLFPIPLAECAMFEPAAWEQTAREAAREAACDGLSMSFAPMLDVSRDPRWGRTAEGPGEDPWVGMRLAEAKVRGLQGSDLASTDAVAAVAKHFCGYGAVLAGREYAPVDISERTLREVHLPPFEAAVTAGVAAIMPAFTDLAGTPMTAHVRLLRHYLRGQLGFEGVLVSDYNAIAELIRHGIAADLPEAAALALQASVDMDMMSDAYRKGLPVALQRGLAAIEDIDASVRRVLMLKERLGLFVNPYGRGSRPDTPAALSGRRQLARSVARRAVVMLKNVAGTLPLRTGLRRLCVLGPLADAPGQMGGPWSAAGVAAEHVTVLEGLRRACPQTQILYHAGVEIEGEDRAGVSSALALCETAEAIVLCLGEAARMSGEAASRATPDLPGQQQMFADAVCERARTLGTPVIVIVFSGRPLMIARLAQSADALLAAWFLGSETGDALADLLLGRHSPSGRTPISWPRVVGQIPVFFGKRPTGRPADAQDHFTSKYLDVANEPLYPFGHGLTYGRFEVTDLRIPTLDVFESDTLTVHVELTNKGERTATETVFLFVHDCLARITRPDLELKAVARIELQAGESGTLTMHVPAAELHFLDADLRAAFEPGEVQILVGPCADRSRLQLRTIRLRAGVSP